MKESPGFESFGIHGEMVTACMHQKRGIFMKMEPFHSLPVVGRNFTPPEELSYVRLCCREVHRCRWIVRQNVEVAESCRRGAKRREIKETAMQDNGGVDADLISPGWLAWFGSDHLVACPAPSQPCRFVVPASAALFNVNVVVPFR